ncbi:hypothetical protein [Bradyrhizobium sp. DASA03120]|uniref:hypothetical protein n=1 Tax=Bradyrhizobium sp. SMVTL-02 TaxID=3395917 RepID=UPI003F71CA8A
MRDDDRVHEIPKSQALTTASCMSERPLVTIPTLMPLPRSWRNSSAAPCRKRQAFGNDRRYLQKALVSVPCWRKLSAQLPVNLILPDPAALLELDEALRKPYSIGHLHLQKSTSLGDDERWNGGRTIEKRVVKVEQNCSLHCHSHVAPTTVAPWNEYGRAPSPRQQEHPPRPSCFLTIGFPAVRLAVRRLGVGMM